MNIADPHKSPADAAAGVAPASNDVLPPDAPSTPAAEAPAASETPGAYLRAARERAGLSIGDVASRLRMGGRQIDALEKAEYTALPTGTFLRGFVRNYARAVGADSAHVIGLLEQTHVDGQPLKSPNIVVPSQNIKLVPAGGELASPKGRIAIGLGVLVLVGLAVAYWWHYIRPNIADGANPKAATEQAVDIPAPSVSVAPAETKSAPAAETPPSVAPAAAVVRAEPAPAPAPAAAVPIPTPTPTPAPATPAAAESKAAPARVEAKPVNPAGTATAMADGKPAAPAKRATGTGILGFTFTGESWVEVADAGGKLLISKRFKAGEAEEATGKTPFSIVIGNAQVTRMAFNGAEFNLVPYTRVSVARVTVK